MGSRAIRAILGETWAIRPEALEQILAIADREHEFAGNLDALEQRMGRPLANAERTSVRDGVAVVPVTGPLFRYANLFTMISGATSYDTLATDLRAAVDDPGVKAIILNIDSPGGAVNGANELAKQVKAVRGIKPIVAYVGGSGASAAYWLASAADEIVADETAMIGSVGAMIGVTITGERQGQKSYTFVSSQSPLKNADPSTETGAREIQRLVDETAQVFVNAVATNRGISSEDVLDNYGQGAVFTGAEAIKRGMVDSMGTFESVLSRLAQGGQQRFHNGRAAARTEPSNNRTGASAGNSNQEDQMDLEKLKAEHPDLYAQVLEQGKAEASATAIKEGAAAERQRIKDIQAMAMPGHDDLVAKAIDDGMSAEQLAVAMVKAEKQKGTDYIAQRAADAQDLNGIPSATPPSREDEVDAEVEKLVAAGRAGFNARAKKTV